MEAGRRGTSLNTFYFYRYINNEIYFFRTGSGLKINYVSRSYTTVAWLSHTCHHYFQIKVDMEIPSEVFQVFVNVTKEAKLSTHAASRHVNTTARFTYHWAAIFFIKLSVLEYFQNDFFYCHKI